MPLEARPLSYGKGAHSYTIKGPGKGQTENGSRVEVLLRERRYFVRTAANGKAVEKPNGVPWTKKGIAEAWDTTKAKAFWSDPAV